MLKRLIVWWMLRRCYFNPYVQGYPPGLVSAGEQIERVTKNPRALVGREFNLGDYRYRVVGWTLAAEPCGSYDGKYEGIRIGKKTA